MQCLKVCFAIDEWNLIYWELGNGCGLNEILLDNN